MPSISSLASISSRRLPLAALLALAPAALAQTATPDDAAAGKLDDGLITARGHAPVFVRMSDQLFATAFDYERFCEAQPETVARRELRQRVRRTLAAKAGGSYAEVQPTVDALQQAGAVRGVRRYWIVNGFACEATAAACRALAALPEVAFVYRQRFGAQHRNRTERTFEPRPELASLYGSLLNPTAEDADLAAALRDEDLEIPWNLEAVGAPRAWAEHGVTGHGVVVAILDDGMMTVPALQPALWRNPGEEQNGKDDDGNGYVDDVFGYDFRADHPYPVSPSGHRHGTLCAGIVAARPTRGDMPIATSVAPGASIMVLVGSGQLRAYEYAVDHGADILSMSYTFEPTRMGQYRGLFRTAHEHLAAAGILAVGGAGNFAGRWPEGRQIGSPKDIPCVIAAAGVGPDRTISSFSSRGPVDWHGIRFFDPTPSGVTRVQKPDVTTCNAGFPMWTRRDVWTGRRAARLEAIVREHGDYVLAIGPRGNSFAGPHAAGVAALMLEANPDLCAWHLQTLMTATCKDLGEPGHDVAYGAGMLQADKAVAAALAAKRD